ncbi:MAG: putative HTH-type transcriptional regulator YfiR [Candidatus Thorarchaeota archaeon AB_25]|nr:MAG: putative HTH-type transcriptional regulator YfiR [Candidatus Thorarchaeota archaeon AB_25]
MPKVVPEYKEKARRSIIESAAQVFAEKGYHKTKMDDIAEKLGVSKGAIYQYFKSKEQIFVEVIDFFMQFKKDEVMSIILSDNPMRIASAEFLEMKIDRALHTQSFGLDLFLEAARNESLRERMAEKYQKIYDEFIGHTEELKEKGVIKKDAEVGVVWRGIVALRDGLISSILLGVNVSDVIETWVKITNMLLKEVLVEVENK